MAGRTLVMTAVLASAALAGAGCASRPGTAHAGRSSSPVDVAARRNIAGRIHYLMNETGLPLEYGHVGCNADPDGRSDSCYGLVSNDPVTPVDGEFTASSPAAGPDGCPGTLNIKFGETLVTTVPENPCR